MVVIASEKNFGNIMERFFLLGLLGRLWVDREANGSVDTLGVDTN